ncbi:MAG: phosphatase PAP2 family protein [Clostridia bacterium]|nr:phosphatase PAP2 family protein [Clostridia bacterium]
MGNAFFFPWEVSLITSIQDRLSDFGVTVMSLISALGEQMIMVFFLAVFYLWIDKDFGKKMGMTIIVGSVFNAFFKNIFLRKRPYMASDSIKCLKPVEKGADIYDPTVQGFSFPSGHSTNGMLCYGSMGLRANRIWQKIILFSVVVLIGISRFALGVHYPTDVLFGFILAAVVMVVFDVLYHKYSFERACLIFAGVGAIGFLFAKSTDYYTSYGLLIGTSLGFFFEKKLVNFKRPKAWYFGVLRVAAAIGLFYALNTVLKLPFDKEFLESAGFLSYLVRTLRYAVTTFVITGLYPLTFRLGDRIGHKK